MKRYLLITVLFLSNVVFSQGFESVDKTVDTYPSFNNTDELALKVNTDFADESQKTRAIFRWIATHIDYDEQLAQRMGASAAAFSYKTEKERVEKEVKFKADLVRKNFQSHTAICHGYAFMVEELCRKCRIECQTVVGFLKSDPEQIGKLPEERNHAWNAVKINGAWKFVDTTLAAGYVSSTTGSFVRNYNEGYFFTSPALFNLNHFPADIKWLLSPLSKKAFAEQPVYYGNYLLKPLNFEFPKSGIISLSASKKAVFISNGIDELDVVEYYLSSGSKKLGIEHGSGQFEILLSDINKDDFLTIFINGMRIVTYKIVG